MAQTEREASGLTLIMRQVLFFTTLAAVSLASCADNNPGEDAGGMDAVTRADADAGARDAVEEDDAGAPDAVLPDALVPDAAGDAGGSMDAEPEDGAFVPVSRCTAPVQIDSVDEYADRPLLIRSGQDIVLLFASGLGGTLAVTAQVGDGVTFGAPIEILADLNRTLFRSDVRVTPGGKIGLIGGTSGSGLRRVADVAGNLGPVNQFAWNADCIGAMSSSGEELIHVRPTNGDGPGLDYANAPGMMWSEAMPVGINQRPLYCAFALSEAGDGAAVITPGPNDLRVGARAFRAGVPTGATATATLTMAMSTLIDDVQASAAADGTVVAIVAYGGNLTEVRFTWDAANRRLVAGTPEPAATPGSPRFDLVYDAQDRLTIVYIAAAHTWTRRKVRGVWGEPQDFGLPSGGGWDPRVAMAPNGDVAVVYTGPGGEALVREAEADSTVFSEPVVAIGGGRLVQFPSLVYLPDGKILVAAPEPMAPSGSNIVASICDR